jgi:hypothetical protein
MDGFKHIPILLNLERLVNGGTFDNLINVIFNSLLIYGASLCKRLIENWSILVQIVLVLSYVFIMVWPQKFVKKFLSCLLSIMSHIKPILLCKCFPSSLQCKKLKGSSIPHICISPLQPKNTLNSVSLSSVGNKGEQVVM